MDKNNVTFNSVVIFFSFKKPTLDLLASLHNYNRDGWEFYMATIWEVITHNKCLDSPLLLRYLLEWIKSNLIFNRDKPFA